VADQGRAAVAAAGDAALLDADDDLVGHPRVERDGPDMGRVRRHGKGPAPEVRQLAEAGQVAEGATAVLADVHRRWQRAQVDLVGPRGMDGERPELAIVDAAGRQLLPARAAVLAPVEVSGGGGIEAPWLEGILADLADVLAVEVRGDHLHAVKAIGGTAA